jgi:hypothetical protein
MSKKIKKDLKKKILEFISAWNEVVELKIFERDADTEERRKKIQESNLARIKTSEEDMFTYIYNWLEISEADSDDPIKPHRAKSRRRSEESRKMRTNEYPIAADIVDYFCDYPSGNYGYEDLKSIENSVGRALSELHDDKKLEKCGSMYYPIAKDGEKQMQATDLDGYSNLKKDCFFSVSKSTYIIYFDSNDLTREISFFEKFYGEDCFDIFAHKHRLIILFKGTNEKCKQLGIRLRRTVKSAYARQEEKRRNAEKRLGIAK